MSARKYDVVIVGAGISGAIIAYELGKAGKRVLILEAGVAVPPNRAAYMETFYLSSTKFPESPYPPAMVDPKNQGEVIDPAKQNIGRASIIGLINRDDASKSYLVQQNPKQPFASTYERLAGGTGWHWLGTSLRLFPADFKMRTTYDVGADWPLGYDELSSYYGKAEHEIGVSADKQAMERLGFSYPGNYDYPMPAIPPTLLDQRIGEAVAGLQLYGQDVYVTPTPAGRNSRPYDGRRACAGNTSCIPICPIQAKYDPTLTLQKALDTGRVEIWPQTVATEVKVDTATGRISGIEWTQYQSVTGGPTARGTAVGTTYVLAAHAVETPKLLLLSRRQIAKGVANKSGMVGRNLMDHIIYMAWALGREGQPFFPYRGPLSTSGIECLRDGPFRRQRASWRIEIGNEGWNWAVGDPNTSLSDFVDGTNESGLNAENLGKNLFGKDLIAAINGKMTRQLRLGFLVEQDPDPNMRVVPSEDPKRVDRLGLPRPEIQGYGVTPYTANGFIEAQRTASAIFQRMGAKEFTQFKEYVASFTTPSGERFNYYGAGHIMGTCKMGFSGSDSVVNRDLRSWDHPNLFIAGSSVFPTVGTGNPTLTIAALAFLAAEKIQGDLRTPSV